jgi:regulator of sigma E protease
MVRLSQLQVPDDFFGKLISARLGGFFSIRYPFIVTGFLDGSAAKESGVYEGDHIMGVGGVSTWSFDEFARTIPEFKGQQTTLTVQRDGELIDLDITIPEEGRIGAYAENISNLLDFETHRYTFLQSIPAGITKAYTTTTGYFRELRLLFRPEVKGY